MVPLNLDGNEGEGPWFSAGLVFWQHINCQRAIGYSLSCQLLSDFYQYGFRVYRPRAIYRMVNAQSTLYTVLVVVPDYPMSAYPTQQYWTWWTMLCWLH
jgi:hypothetical protein